MNKFKNKYRIESARLKNWDYGSNAIYFITICTKNREHYFGNIAHSVQADDCMQPHDPVQTCHDAPLSESAIGKIAFDNWKQIPDHFPFVQLDEFVIMPDHLHGILIFNKPNYTAWKPNAFGPQSQNLATVVGRYKGSVTRFANMNDIEFGWQTRFYDSIIRTDGDMDRVRKYIIDNPAKWDQDENK